MSESNTIKNTKKPSIALMNQLPVKSDAENLAQSPLFNSGLNSELNSTPISSVNVKELNFFGHLVIRCNAEDKELGLIIERVLGVALPSTLQSVRTNDMAVYWISPDEWLVVCSGQKVYDLEKSFDETMSGHCAIVNVSGGQTVLTIAGEGARAVLMKSTPYDVSEQNFPIGKVVTSALGKSQALICRVSDDKWELIIRRSFADYIGLWLQKTCENMA